VKTFKFIFFLLFFVTQSYADEYRAGLSSQLKYIRGKIVQIEQELSPLKKEEEEITNQRDQLIEQVKSLSEQEKRMRIRLVEITKSQEALNIQMSEVRDQILKKKVTFEKRVIHMYKTRRRLMPLSFLLSTTGGAEDFYKRSSYLRYLVQNDSNRLREFTNLLETLRSSREEFASLSKEYEEELKNAQSTKKTYDEKQLELAKLAKSLESKIIKINRRLEIYNAQEEEYESLLNEISKVKSDSSEMVPSSKVLKPKSLAFPVNGTIIQHFGKQKHGEFKDIVFVKGIEVTTNAEENVKVVLPGEVVFSSELPGFGSVLIVAHGGGIFSLYGRISPVKGLGDQLKADEIIARTTSGDPLGRNFYFELRKEGKALNPEAYFLR
jgi:septal ring factor EnvC (AmiA/AmiB activator)